MRGRLKRRIRHLLSSSALCIWIAKAAHSRPRVSSRPRTSSSTDYDRSITTFDTTGRLLQVEYGMEAAGRGSPILATLLCNNTVGVLVTAAGSHLNTVHRVDDHVLLFATGLAGDARAMAGSLRTFCQQQRLSCGEPATMAQVARHAAQIQHDLTRTGGTRPLGISCLLVGTCVGRGLESDDEVRLYRVDPGGALQDCLYQAIGQRQDDFLKSLDKRYDEYRDSELSQSVNAIIQHIRTLRATIMEKEEAVDVWLLRYDRQAARGNVQIRCYVNADAKNITGGTKIDFEA